MRINKKHERVVITYSCLTGRAVWLYFGRLEESARKNYYRACQYEIERVKKWRNIALRRKANLAKMMGTMTANLPAIGTLSSEQETAIRQILSVSNEEFDCNRDFYNHIFEERRRRKKNHKK